MSQLTSCRGEQPTIVTNAANLQHALEGSQSQTDSLYGNAEPRSHSLESIFQVIAMKANTFDNTFLFDLITHFSHLNNAPMLCRLS